MTVRETRLEQIFKKKKNTPHLHYVVETNLNTQPVIRPLLNLIPYKSVRIKAMLKHATQRGETRTGCAGTINRFISFEAPQEQIERYQLGYRLIGLG